MFTPTFIGLIVCAYVAGLFAVAIWGERTQKKPGLLVRSGVIYALSLAVYCTSWTYYGSVGKAATSGIMFLTIYLGPTLGILLFWILLRKMVRAKTRHRITSIADFISSRYDKSQLLAATATIIALVGTVPYIALQLKAVISSFHLVTTGGVGVDLSWLGRHIGPVIVLVLAAFTILFGVRRLDPTERHQGMMLALGVECMVKLVAFMAVGIYVTYFLFDGLGDIAQRVESGAVAAASNALNYKPPFTTWATYTLLAMSAFFFLPRQFHVSVIENSHEKHIKTAQWVVPFYLLMINLFVIPIALAGLLLGHPAQMADTFVLRLPFENNQEWLSLLAFIGGFSAAMGMVVICAMTMSTMVTNHLLLPFIERVRPLMFLRRHLLRCRWAVVVLFLGAGYGFTTTVGDSYMLVNMGMLSFAAVLQFAPAIIGGMFWRKGNKAGAFAGMTAGFGLWVYTLLVPAFVKSGWMPQSIMESGPFGFGILHPEALLGLTGLDPLSHAVFWTLSANAVAYVLGSVLIRTTRSEEELRREFIKILESPAGSASAAIECRATIAVGEKVAILNRLFGAYLAEEGANQATEWSIQSAGIEGLESINVLQLADLTKAAENRLSGSIGSAAAFHAIQQSGLFAKEEKEQLSQAYSDILAQLRVSPDELRQRVSFHQEREALLFEHAKDLERTVESRTTELRATNESLTQEIEERLKAQQESERLHAKLLDTSRKAGMAEVASNVLHNVGNILNSVSVSSSILMETINTLRTEQLGRVVAMIRDNAKRLAAFLTEDERGRLVPEYLHKVSDSLSRDREKLLAEMNSLSASINHINEVIRVQQDHAVVSRNLIEEILLCKIVRDAVRVVCPTKGQRPFEVRTIIDDDLMVVVDKHKLLQVLVNVIRNAKHSLQEAYPNGGGRMEILAVAQGTEVLIKIEDDGIGIPEDNLELIFRHGFTTKRDGHGFGLHGSANAAKEMGGEIEGRSPGPGRGATFVIRLPRESALEEAG